MPRLVKTQNGAALPGVAQFPLVPLQGPRLAGTHLGNLGTRDLGLHDRGQGGSQGQVGLLPVTIVTIAGVPQVKEYDSISRLDQWLTTMLLRVKKTIQGDEEDLR